MILDGGMGTMIQNLQFEEEDFRGLFSIQNKSRFLTRIRVISCLKKRIKVACGSILYLGYCNNDTQFHKISQGFL